MLGSSSQQFRLYLVVAQIVKERKQIERKTNIISTQSDPATCAAEFDPYIMQGSEGSHPVPICESLDLYMQ